MMTIINTQKEPLIPRSDERLRLIVESAPYAMLLVDEQGNKGETIYSEGEEATSGSMDSTSVCIPDKVFWDLFQKMAKRFASPSGKLPSSHPQPWKRPFER